MRRFSFLQLVSIVPEGVNYGQQIGRVFIGILTLADLVIMVKVGAFIGTHT